MPRKSRATLPRHLHRVARVAELTGISEHALRMWDRRYGNFASERSASGYRLYSQADVERLRVIKELLERGHLIGELSGLPVEQLERTLAAESSEDGGDVHVAREGFLQALREDALERAGEEIARVRSSLTPSAFVTDLVLPLANDVRYRREVGVLAAPQAAAARAILCAALANAEQPASPLRHEVGRPKVVVLGVEGDDSELEQLTCVVICASEGAEVVRGAPLAKPEEAAQRAADAEAELVVVPIASLPHREAKFVASELRRALPANVALWTGGRALTVTSRDEKNAYLDLRQACEPRRDRALSLRVSG